MHLASNLVLTPWVLSIVSPFLKANLDGRSCAFAILIILSHCSAVAKLEKYSARGLQLKTCTRKTNYINTQVKGPTLISPYTNFCVVLTVEKKVRALTGCRVKHFDHITLRNRRHKDRGSTKILEYLMYRWQKKKRYGIRTQSITMIIYEPLPNNVYSLYP